MNAIHPSNHADLPESASTTISADRKLMSWELRDFVTEYQTYPSPGAAAVASRLAARYNDGLGYSYETQRQISERTGFTRNAVARYLSEIESTGLWVIEHGQPGVASRYAPIAPELRKAKMFVEYRMAGKLSSFPYPKVPNFVRPDKNTGELKGLAKVSTETKKARDIREAAEAAAIAAETAPETPALPAPEPAAPYEPQSAYGHEITAYTPDDLDDIPFPDEPYFDEPAEADDPFLSRDITDPTEPFPTEQFNEPLPAAATTIQPAFRPDDGCPF